MLSGMGADDEALRGAGASINKPSGARVYDYYLGGNHHYAIDEMFGRKVQARVPLVTQAALTCRQFLGRAVRYCANAGITQFVDIGSGLPTEGNVHEVADQARPERDTRVVYIDNEPITLMHSQILLADTAQEHRHQAIAADLRQPADLWRQVLRTRIIDRNRPIALIINAVLHFIKDEQDPDSALAYYRERLAPGSMLVLSQLTSENPDGHDEWHALTEVVEYYETTTNPGQARTSEEFSRFFGDWTLVAPGLVYAPAWHPEKGIAFADAPSKSMIIAGVARKPA
jgi:O-methyltransferase involved in polyketide biosynthesis